MFMSGRLKGRGEGFKGYRVEWEWKRKGQVKRWELGDGVYCNSCFWSFPLFIVKPRSPNARSHSSVIPCIVHSRIWFHLGHTIQLSFNTQETTNDILHLSHNILKLSKIITQNAIRFNFFAFHGEMGRNAVRTEPNSGMRILH